MMPSLVRRSETSGLLANAATSFRIAVMISAGVPVGAKNPFHDENSNPGKVSATAGISGALGIRCGVPTAISRTFRQGEPISDLVIKARLSRTPTNITSTNVRDSLDFLAGTPTIAAEADGSFTATLQVVTRKPEPGTYSGAYSLVLCKSNDCSVVQALSPSSVPYTFTVTPLVSASFKLDGELQSQLTRGIDVYGVGWYRVDMKSGNQIEIESSLPVTWKLSDGLDSTIANIETPSPTTWRAVITLKDGLAAWLDDTISFRGLTADQQGINVDVHVSH